MNRKHREILDLIIQHSGRPAKHPFLNNYLGNDHPRYDINSPTLRSIAKAWMKEYRHLSAAEIQVMLTSLIEGKTSTEKFMAGILLDATTKEQKKFDATIFDNWLDHLVGWAEVDSVCTGHYTISEIPANWNTWRKLLTRFSKSQNINKRRASLVLLCSPLRKVNDDRLAAMAFANIEKLKHEKEVLITKAISWVLRSMANHYKKETLDFVTNNKETLPAIAVRETLVKLKTGRKGKKKETLS